MYVIVLSLRAFRKSLLYNLGLTIPIAEIVQVRTFGWWRQQTVFPKIDYNKTCLKKKSLDFIDVFVFERQGCRVREGRDRESERDLLLAGTLAR